MTKKQKEERRSLRGGRRRLLITPHGILWAVTLLLVLNAVSVGLVFARFQSASAGYDDARAATFAPTVSYGEKWEQALTFSGINMAAPVTLPFSVSNIKTEVSTKVVVTVEHYGDLPLDYSLYTCAEEDIASATPAPPTSVTADTVVFEVDMAPGAVQAMTLAVSWRAGVAYNELFNARTESVTLTVLCEQI